MYVLHRFRTYHFPSPLHLYSSVIFIYIRYVELPVSFQKPSLCLPVGLLIVLEAFGARLFLVLMILKMRNNQNVSKGEKGSRKKINFGMFF